MIFQLFNEPFPSIAQYSTFRKSFTIKQRYQIWGECTVISTENEKINFRSTPEPRYHTGRDSVRGQETRQALLDAIPKWKSVKGSRKVDYSFMT